MLCHGRASCLCLFHLHSEDTLSSRPLFPSLAVKHVKISQVGIYTSFIHSFCLTLPKVLLCTFVKFFPIICDKHEDSLAIAEMAEHDDILFDSHIPISQPPSSIIGLNSPETFNKEAIFVDDEDDITFNTSDENNLKRNIKDLTGYEDEDCCGCSQKEAKKEIQEKRLKRYLNIHFANLYESDTHV